MAGKVTANTLQLGDSATATQNFVLQTNVDGSAKLARGNAGATTQDVLTVDASGVVSFPQGTSGVLPTQTGNSGKYLTTNGTAASWGTLDFTTSLAASGYQKLPSGLIIQWGTLPSTNVNGTGSATFPITFPTACQFVCAQTTGGAASWWSNATKSTTGCSFTLNGNANAITGLYIAIGY